MQSFLKASLLLGLIILIIICCISTSANALSPPKIFILHSYGKGNICGQPQHDGLIAALQKAGYVEGHNVTFDVYYMDTKRRNNTPELIFKQAQIALQKIRSVHPSVLVTLDDNAFRSVALKLVDTPLPIVFSGMNGQPEDYNRHVYFMDSRFSPGHNITGVYEKLHIADAFRVHCRLFPDTRKIKIIVDRSPTGKAVFKQIKIELAKESVPCMWHIRVVRTWEEYQEQIRRANMNPEISALYPVALLLKDRSRKTYTAPQIFSWTVKNSIKPELAVNYAFTRLGLFGGAAVDFFAMGQQAGQMVVRVLNGEGPGQIPIEEAQKYALTFNLKRAEQLGIKIPEDIIMAADDIVIDNTISK